MRKSFLILNILLCLTVFVVIAILPNFSYVIPIVFAIVILQLLTMAFFKLMGVSVKPHTIFSIILIGMLSILVVFQNRGGLSRAVVDGDVKRIEKIIVSKQKPDDEKSPYLVYAATFQYPRILVVNSN